MATLIEYLPDEVLLIICRYLSQYDIIRAFLGLNYRLNCTVSQFTQSLVLSYGVKHDRAGILLSLIGPELRSLTIKSTPLSSEEISLAPNIEEITFVNTDPYCLPVLKNLTDLNIINGPAFASVNSLFSKTNNLHSIYIDSTNALTIPLFSPPKFSIIKQLAITLQSSKDLIRLLYVCPELTCLNVTLKNYKVDEQMLNETLVETPANLRIFSFRTIYDINVNFSGLKNLFKYLTSKLEHLSLEVVTDDIACLDGQLWESYLKETFPELNHLAFFILCRKGENEEYKYLKVADVLETFQSLYWSTVVPQSITGYYNRTYNGVSTCIHSDVIPTVQRRRYFLY